MSKSIKISSRIIEGKRSTIDLEKREGGPFDSDSTMYRDLSYSFYHDKFNTVDLDYTGKFGAFAGRRGFVYLVNLENPDEVTQSFHFKENWDVSSIQWNHHASTEHQIATASNKSLRIWDAEKNKLLTVKNQAHLRAIADISWSVREPNILASISADTYIHIWDIRTRNRYPVAIASPCIWSEGHLVNWNRFDSNILGSARDGTVDIWDLRHLQQPETVLHSHSKKMTSLEWSYQSEKELLTSSFGEPKVKFWNYDVPQDSIRSIDIPGSGSVIKAGFAPFGNNVVTASNKLNENIIQLWDLNTIHSTPVPTHNFCGNNDNIITFCWRSNAFDHQLVSWGKDKHLRMWYVDFLNTDQPTEFLSSSPILKIGSYDRNEKIITKSDNIDKEFIVLEKLTSPYKNQLKLFNIDKAKRSFKIKNVRDVPFKLKLFIKFPPEYSDAVPSFTFLPNTNLDPSLVDTIQKKLIKTAKYYIERKQYPYIENILSQLSLMLPSDSGDKSNRIFDDELETNRGGISLENDIGSHEGMTDMNEKKILLYPACSGATFSANGKLIVFSNQSKGLKSDSKRTYTDFKSRNDGQNEPSYSIEGFLYNSKARNFIETGRKKPSRCKPRVTQYDTLSLENTFSILLASSYKIFCSQNISDVCAMNSKIARKHKRNDLGKTWSLLSAVCNPNLYSGQENELSVFCSSWSYHPFGKRLAKSLFDHYEKKNDIQTLAMMACVLSLPFQTDPKVPNPLQNNLINPELLDKYDQYKLSYAELLLRWGLLNQRAEVLKCLSNYEMDSNPIQLRRNCYICNQETNALTCYHCNRASFSCTICETPVKGQSIFCFRCGHGGHLSHMTEWFQTETVCPSVNCICQCKTITIKKE